MNEIRQHSLQVQRSRGCVWFGEPGHCGTFTLLLAVLTTCALGDFVVTIIMVWNLLLSDSSMIRLQAGTHVGSSHLVSVLQMLVGSEAIKRVRWKRKCVTHTIVYNACMLNCAFQRNLSASIKMQRMHVQSNVGNGCSNMALSGRWTSAVSVQPISFLEAELKCIWMHPNKEPLSGCEHLVLNLRRDHSALCLNVHGAWGRGSDTWKLALRAQTSKSISVAQSRLTEAEESTRGCGDIGVDCCQLAYLLHHHSWRRGLLHGIDCCWDPNLRRRSLHVKAVQ
jgi:hypothetical protein